MVFGIEALLVLLALFCIGSLFYWTRGIEEAALRCAVYKCKQLDLQLLDQTLAFDKMSILHPESRRFGFWRIYQFEFSADGDDRYKASLMMNGRRLDSFDIPTHRYQQSVH